MNPLPPWADANGEIVALIKTLLAAEQRLVELTAGEVDAVADGEGRTFLLRRAQEQLRSSDAGKQAAILNALPAHIALLDAQGVIVSVNEAWRHSPGEHLLRGPEQNVGFNYLAHCARAGGEGAADAGKVAAGIQAVLAGERPTFSIEYARRTPAGPGWHRLTVTPLTEGPHPGAVIMHLDITERRRAERERKRFFMLSPDLLCIVGFDGNFQQVNPAFLKQLGFTEAELYARPMIEFVHPDDRAVTTAEMARLESGATTLDFENRYLCRDGAFRWMSWTAVPYPEDRTVYAAGHDITERKRVEETLRDKNTLLRIAGRITRTGGWALEVPSERGFWSDEIFDILGFARGPVPPLPDLLALYAESSQAPITAAVTACMREGVPFDLELEILTAAKKTIAVRVSGEAQRRPDGSIVRVQGAFQDITERRQAEEGIRLFRTLVDQSSDSLEIVEAESGRFLDGNASGYASLGYTREEFLARGVADIDPGVAKTGWPENRENIRRAGTLSGTTTHRRSDGIDFPVEYSAKWVHLDRDYIVTVVRDITQRTQSEQQLQLLSSAVEQSTESILITDARIEPFGPEILFVNPAFTAMTGYTASDVIGRTPQIMQGPRSDPAVRQRLRDCLARGEVFFGQTVNYRKNGTEFQMESQVTPIRNAAGVVTHFVALQRDVTERMKLAEQSLRAQRLESIGMLAAGISHDLNNVLAPIGMAVSLLRTRLTDAKDLNLLDILEKSGQRGAGLVRQILGFVHGISGEPRLVQVKHLLNDVSEMIAETFPKSIILECSVPGDLWLILANPTQIHQVLLNLCVNARDAMPEGGTLTLRAENCLLDAKGARAIEGASPGAWLMLEVGDTGTGIAPEILARIWEPFFTTKAVGHGTGLGLSTVRGIVETSHGFISIQTRVGHGTTIRAYLPVAPSSSEERGSTSPFAMSRGRQELILLVDDELSIREIAHALLTEAGYRVIAAADGAEAMVMFEQHQAEIALIITDLDMPLVDGPTLARFVTALRPETRILAMSGVSSRWTKVAPGDFASAFISKPFAAAVLLNEVEKLLHPNRTALAQPALLP